MAKFEMSPSFQPNTDLEHAQSGFFRGNSVVRHLKFDGDFKLTEYPGYLRRQTKVAIGYRFERNQ